MTAPHRRGRSGRRPGSPDTRSQILEAARTEFAERGYESTSMRGIAGRAGVNAALLHHYFGTKEQLFVAAVELPFDPDDVAAAMASVPQGRRGEQLVRTFFGIWEEPSRREPILALLRSALAHESAAALLRQFGTRVMVPRVTPSVRGPDAELHAEAAVSHLIGLALARYVLKVEPLASTPLDELVALVGPVVQRYFDG